MKRFISNPLFLFVVFGLAMGACSSQSDSDPSPASASTGGSSGASGQGGSLARFALTNNHLYAVDKQNLHSFSLANPGEPVPGSKIQLNVPGGDVETIFPYKGNLFIGSQTGFFIYSTHQNPSEPNFVSSVSHWRVCDPVVADDNFAYRTLRTGETVCGTQLENLLVIYDIQNMEEPREVHRMELDNPYGLGVDEDVLFVCDGIAGLKVYKMNESRTSLELINQFGGMNAYDVIPSSSTLILSSTNGIHQYDYSDPMNIEYLGKITFAI